MVDLWVQFVFAWWILFPAYAANVFPPLVRGKIKLDENRKLKDGKRILGDGKTLEGIIAGVVMGTAIGALEWAVMPFINAYSAQFGVVFPHMSIFVGFLIAFGAVSGDIAASFIKRRIGMRRGESALFADQLDFIAGAIVFSFAFTQISIYMIMIMLVVTPAIHFTSCIIGYKLGVKKVPW
ncbi:MAG: CDP-2,3-bis-(O-geranylgeranyl)-sn-glycerol synthase [Candidatus Aenigmatarchaeota archaeon]